MGVIFIMQIKNSDNLNLDFYTCYDGAMKNQGNHLHHKNQSSDD